MAEPDEADVEEVVAEPEPRLARVEIYTDHGAEVRWRLIAANGETVLPPQGHRDATDAKRALTRASGLLAQVLAAGEVYVVGLEPG